MNFSEINSKQTSRGFTLIELLVVISIIGLLSSIILTSLNSARNKAYDGQRLANLHSMQTALEIYYANNSSYPSTGGTYRSQCTIDGNIAANSVIPGLVPAFLPSMPLDPQVNIASSQCCYRYVSDGVNYKLLFGLTCPVTNVCNPPPASYVDPAHGLSCAVYSAGGSAF